MENATGKQVQAKFGKYMAVNALSRRVRALQSGHKPLVNRPATNLPAVAVEEFLENKLDVHIVEREERSLIGENEQEPSGKASEEVESEKK